MSKRGNTVHVAILDIITGHELSGWSNWAHFNNSHAYYARIGRILEKTLQKMPFDIYHTISETTKQDIRRRPNARIIPGIDMSKAPAAQC